MFRSIHQYVVLLLIGFSLSLFLMKVVCCIHHAILVSGDSVIGDTKTLCQHKFRGDEMYDLVDDDSM